MFLNYNLALYIEQWIKVYDMGFHTKKETSPNKIYHV